ncbi:2-isopropylmalate synthase [Marinobacter sp. BW6]|uniref:2-isopropylmalate synthase n=1 Tax=Marinobacter sp. BW6 TaxID=2592624 RepID=UPI0011DE6D3E|nr:2-isopropylmalate synthase [Marinobacter sp. BW6]TYC59554.1 2-isopropylmalate synthase [Marinobacter sp. BW6]
MIGSEAERQFYLGAAGIRMWYARQPLPGAAPSPEFEFPEETGRPEAAPGISEPVSRPVNNSGRPARDKPTRPDRTEGVARIADLQALMEAGVGASGQTSGQPQESPPLPGAATDSPEPVPLEEGATPSSMIPSESVNLTVWAGSGAVLIGGMSADASSRLQETLALNILKSMGESQPRVLGQVAWPIFNNLLVPGNSGQDFVEVMRSVLSGLERQQVVVLQGGKGSEQSWLREALGREAAVRFPHTLAEIAGNPTLKRSLWQQIRPLVAL